MNKFVNYTNLKIVKLFALKNILIVLLIILSCTNKSISNNEIDSLNNLLKTLSENEKPNVLNELASRYWFSDPKKSFELTWKALEISNKMKSDSLIASTLFTIGISHLIVSNNDSAIYYLNISLDKFKIRKDTLRIANNLRALGDVYDSKMDIVKAKDYYLNSYKLFDIVLHGKGDLKKANKLFSILLNNLGSFYVNLDNYKEAKKYFEQAKIYYNNINNQQGISIAYFNIGNCWYELKNKDSSIENYIKSYKLASEINNLTIKANSMVALSRIYYEDNKLDESYNLLEQAFEYLTKVEDKYGTNLYYMVKGQLLFQQKQFIKSIENFKISSKYAIEINQYPYLINSYKYLYLAYDSLKDYKNSNYYLKLYSDTRDSVSSIERTKTIQEIDQKFNSEKKEIENERLRHINQMKELNNNRLQIIILSLVIILALIIILLLINNKRQKLIERLNNELNETNIQLENLNANKDKFFAIIAHDLKNPLGSFRNITSLMHERAGDFNENDRNEMLSLIKDSANNVYNLLENLLTWSSSQRGMIYFKPALFNISELFDTNIKLLTSGFIDKRILLINSVPNPINLVADFSMMNTIIRNLMTNALKFTTIGGKIEVGVIQFLTSKTLPKSDEFITFYILDTGVGIPENIIDKLFRIDESISTKGTSEEEGTGLGLILCKEFIEMHGGKIWVESEVGVGSTFYFSIPSI